MNATVKTDHKCESCGHSDCRKTFGNGPWETEPDRVEFTHNGLHCLLHRSWLGYWCGYVGVGPEHPCYGASRQDLPRFSVHGGITYADACEGEICHVPREGDPDDLWWIGFDCGHKFDLIPAFGESQIFRSRSTYRDLYYVRTQTERLAEQLVFIQG